MLFNANNTILSCFFFLIIDLYFLTPAAIAKILNLIANLLTAIGIPTKEARTEMETDSVIAEAKLRRCSI